MRPKRQHLKRRPDGRYACRYHEQWFYGASEAEALQAREEYKHRERLARHIRENPNVREYSAQWLALTTVQAQPKTKESTAGHLKHLCAVLGEVLVAEVRPSDIKRVYSERYADCSASYITHAHCVFKALFAAAQDDGIIVANPAAAPSAKPHRGHSGGHRAITAEERQLIETVATDHPMHTAAIIMLYAGLRPQEVKALRVEDITDMVRVRHFVHISGRAYVEAQEGKTKKATRDIPVFPPVREAIKGKTGLLLGGRELASRDAWKRAWLSYQHQIERHLNGCYKGWYVKTKAHKALLAEGKPLPPWRSFTVTPYDLRHSFAAWCRDNGVELNTVIRWMGHTDASMILKIYDEVSDTRSNSEAEKLIQRAFGGQPGSQEEQAPTASPAR